MVSHKLMPNFSKKAIVVISLFIALLVVSPMFLLHSQSVTNAPVGSSPGGSYSEYQYRGGQSTFSSIANTAPMTLTGWTAVNFGSSAAVDDFSGDAISMGIGNNTTWNYREYCRSLASAPYSAIMTAEVQIPVTVIGARFFGLALYDGTKIEEVFEVYTSTISGETQISYATSLTTIGTTEYGASAQGFGTRFTFKVVDNGTNRIWYQWVNGAFVTLFTEATNANLTPTSVCFGGAVNDSTVGNYPTISGKVMYFCVSGTSTCNGQ